MNGGGAYGLAGTEDLKLAEALGYGEKKQFKPIFEKIKEKLEGF